MKKSNLLLLLGILFLIVSCSNSTLLNTLEDVKNIEMWAPDELKVFEFEVDDTIPKFNFGVNIHHDLTHETPVAPMVLSVLAPSGKRIDYDLTLALLDSSKMRLGDSGSDFFELSYMVVEKFRFSEIGIHEVELVPAQNCVGIRRIGVWIKKAELKK